MPIYDFKHKETGEVIEATMKWSDRDKWLEDHPEYEYTISAPMIGDPVRLGITKPPSDFQKYIIGGIRDKMSGSDISSRFGIPKEH